jgi:hypothetical protein
MSPIPLNTLRKMIENERVTVTLEGQCVDGYMWIELLAEPLDEEQWHATISTDDGECWVRDIPVDQLEDQLIEVIATVQNILSRGSKNEVS